MSTKEKLEQVLEMLVNEENDKASELLHDVFVEKAKNIYAELVESDESVEEDVTEDIGADPEQDLADDIESDSEEIEAEEMFSEEDMDDEEAADDLGASMDVADDAGEEGGEEEVKDAMMNVEDAMAELKSAFAAMTGDEADDEAPAEDEAEMAPEMESAEAEADTEESLEEDFEDLEEAASLSKVNMPKDPVGADSGAQKSPVASKNDMGGKAVDIAGSEESGRTAPKASDMKATTEPAEREVKADHKDGTDNSKSPIGS
jgi:hypothetical protein